MSRWWWCLPFFLAPDWVLAAPPAPPARPVVDLQCVSFGMGPQLECTVRLQRADGAPLTGAQVRLGATMPTMPMAHTVKPAAATATAQPGEYRGLLQLEMYGVWAVEVDIAGPTRERVVRSLRIDECEGERRCPAPASTATRRKP